ncbi:MAG: metallophosphoesterase [Myxococcales bacterium]|nr:metallophosphoesterase [Myxococcales bacterium]
MGGDPHATSGDAPVLIDLGDDGWARVAATALDTRDAIAARAPAILERVAALSNGLRAVAAFEAGRDGAILRASREHATEAGIWFLGDLHGDVLALEAALAAIDERDPGARVVLLGDLIDDAPARALVLRVMELMLDEPGRFTLLAGNHDDALSAPREPGGAFTSRVEPGDFALELTGPHDAALGLAYVRVVAEAPRALLFEDGLLATHAGVPHRDLLSTIRTVADLSSTACQSDFMWLRAANAPRKRPNRFALGGSFGWEDLRVFFDHVAPILGHPLTGLVRGHDHVAGPFRIDVPAAWGRTLMTLNAMSRRLPREAPGPHVRLPVIARHRPGGLPEPMALAIPNALVRTFYPEDDA